MLAQDAVDRYHRGQIENAAREFEEAARLDPNIAAIQLNLGFANLALYQASPKSPEGARAATKAIAAFSRYLELKPNDERALQYLVQTFVDTGHYEDAVKFFRPAVEKNPPDDKALGTLGTIAMKSGRFADAKMWYEKRINAYPENADARLQLVVLIWDFLHNHLEVTGQQRLDMANEAIKEAEEAIRINPRAPMAYTYINLIYREKATGETDDDAKRIDLEQANKYYKQSIELQKSSKGSN